MSEIKESPVKTLRINLSDEGNYQTLIDDLKQLKKNGFEEIDISIYGSARKMAVKLGFNIELFNKIIEVQEIPGWVVLNLMKSKGALSNSKIKV